MYFFIQNNSQPISFFPGKTNLSPSPVVNIVHGEQRNMLFVPYWTIGSEKIPTDYDTVIYFGITVGQNGINRTEDGYRKLKLFTQIKQQRSLLVVRMLDADVNAKALRDKNFQKEIIAESIEIAKSNGFSGIVLDFEYNALAFDSVVSGITLFSTNFASSAHKSSLSYFQTMYGDVFYRLRPFDVGAIGKKIDGFFVLAYDLHKANGDPGPNFPLSGKEEYGYDLHTMMSDFLKVVPSNKLIVTFGLYGYDWTISDKNQSLGLASSLSDSEIMHKFSPSCMYAQCVSHTDQLSQEIKLTYADASSKKHIVWYENQDSVEIKKKFLKTQGVEATALWAWSYF